MLVSLDSVFKTANLSQSLFDNPIEDNRQRFLSFPISTFGNSLIPLEQITEIMRISLDEVLSVPETPSTVLGAYNWRGEMLWLMDLEHMTGGTPLFEQIPLRTQPIAIVLQVDNYCFGLIVRSVNEIELHDMKKILSAKPGSFSARLLPFITGYLPKGSTVFNPKAVVQFFLKI
ncbi:chemotaxis protein CheW [Nostoc sp. CENA67]|uniref:Chemotaxis protein CheW n=1 Tax=Amazonocrinis nigriterrae CENA67 TaxID=2794033 RepID=A0A8J7L7J8_9NOST|nr:chemotaxis protein CheW [Amazonocrinis nigriterrae]MBH8561091.1 chemotaxis protein CheW [Amazonocrinis nigriterrae CENA67]